MWPLLIFWNSECSTLTASSFRILSSSAEIQSPPVLLFIVMLPKAHLTLYSRISGYRWVTIPSWLSRLLRPFFVYSSSVYSCHLFLISLLSIRSLLFLSFIMSILSWFVPLISLMFLKRSLVFPILCFPLFLCTDHWGRLSYLLLLFGTLHSNGYIFPFFLCLSLLIFSQLFVRPPQTTILSFCISFSWGWFWSPPPVQCYEPPSKSLHVCYQT